MPSRNAVSRGLWWAVVIMPALVGLLHMAVTTNQCLQITSASREMLAPGGAETVELHLRGGLTTPMPTTRGVRLSVVDREARQIAINYIASDDPPFLPHDVARQYVTGLLLLVLGGMAAWLGRAPAPRWRDVLAIVCAASGTLLALAVLAGGYA